MACFDVEGDVVALASRAISGPSGAGSKVSEPPQLHDAAATLRTLFTTAHALNDQHGEHDDRPQKRRKIDAKVTTYDHHAYLPEARSVPLAKVSIHLVGPHFECCCISRSQTDDFLDTRPHCILQTARANRHEDGNACHLPFGEFCRT